MLEYIDIRVMSNGSIFLIEKNGTIKQRQIEPQSLFQVLQSSIEDKVVNIYESPPLPKNCIYYGVIEWFMKEPAQVVVIERDKCIRPYNHFGDTYMVGYPKLLFAYLVKGGRVTSTAVVAAKDEFIKSNSSVYHFPYGNVYDNGRVCWGNFSHPPVTELADLTFYPESFYLIEHTHAHNAAGQVVADLLHKDKEFDDSKLVFMATFEKFVKNYLGGMKND